MKTTFGAFVSKKRNEKQITLRRFSRMIGISPVYVSNIENGIRSAPSQDVLVKIAKVLMLDEYEIELMYDLAAKSKNSPTLAIDLTVYINDNENVFKALRIAKRCEANENDWQMFIDMLSNKYL
ncbi:MAG: helix-turn-helix transcriptional regulator [Ruminococcus sp.]|nr:helix-turn-helix transcriptional regulator [Ruminococcus sp.]